MLERQDYEESKRKRNEEDETKRRKTIEEEEWTIRRITIETEIRKNLEIEENNKKKELEVTIFLINFQDELDRKKKQQEEDMERKRKREEEEMDRKRKEDDERRRQDEENIERQRARLVSEEKRVNDDIEKKRREEEEYRIRFAVEIDNIKKQEEEHKKEEEAENALRKRLLKEEELRKQKHDDELRKKIEDNERKLRKQLDDEELKRLRKIKEEELKLSNIQTYDLGTSDINWLKNSKIDEANRVKRNLEDEALWRISKEQELLKKLSDEENLRRQKYNKDLNDWRLNKETLERSKFLQEEEENIRKNNDNIEKWRDDEEKKLKDRLDKEAEDRRKKLLEDELKWKLGQEEKLAKELLEQEENRKIKFEEEEIRLRNLKEGELKKKLLREEEDKWRAMQADELNWKLEQEEFLMQQLAKEEEERRIRAQNEENVLWKRLQEEELRKWKRQQEKKNKDLLNKETELRESLIVRLEDDAPPVVVNPRNPTPTNNGTRPVLNSEVYKPTPVKHNRHVVDPTSEPRKEIAVTPILKSEVFPQTGPLVDSIVQCWRNPKDNAARDGYAERQLKNRNMHKMKPTKDMLSSMCQHEAYLTDRDANSPLKRSRYDAEVTISAPGLIDQDVHKSSLIYKDPKEDWQSRQMNSPQKARNPELYHSTLPEKERLAAYNKSKQDAPHHPGYGKSYQQKKSFKENSEKYFWEPSREKDGESHYFTESKKPQSEYRGGSAENIEYVKATPAHDLHHSKPWNTSKHQQNKYLEYGEKIPKQPDIYVSECRPLAWRSGTKSKKSAKKVKKPKKNTQSSNKKKVLKPETQKRYTSPGKKLVYPADDPNEILYHSGYNTRSPTGKNDPKRYFSQIDNFVKVKGVLSNEDLIRAWERFLNGRGGLKDLSYKEYMYLVDEFKLYWYEKSHKQLPVDYYQILDDFRVRCNIHPMQQVVYLDDGYQELTDYNRKTFLKFDSMVPKTKVVKQPTLRVTDDSLPRKSYYNLDDEIISPTRRRVLVDQPQFVEEIVSPTKRRAVGGLVNEFGELVTNVSPDNRRIVYEKEPYGRPGLQEIVSPTKVSPGRNVKYVNQPIDESALTYISRNTNGTIPRNQQVIIPQRTHTHVLPHGNHSHLVQHESHSHVIPHKNHVHVVDHDRYTTGYVRPNMQRTYTVPEQYYEVVSPTKRSTDKKPNYDRVLPRVNTNLINNPNEVIKEVQQDHGYKHDDELVWSPGKKVTKTSGVYATSKPLSHGHVGLNKVNPIYERVRNAENIQQKHTEFNWRHRHNTYTGEGDQPQLIVKEEVSPSKLSRRSQERYYTVQDTHDVENIMASYVLKRGSPEKFAKLHHVHSSPQKKASDMSFNEFAKRYNQFEDFKKGLPDNTNESDAIQMFQDKMNSESPGRRSTGSRNNRSTGSLNNRSKTSGENLSK